MLQALLDNLPHGSGIDGDWAYHLARETIRLSNAYHCMSDGIYDGWVDFWITVDKDLLLSGNYDEIAQTFTLQFLGERSKELAEKHDLRQYLEHIFSNYFQELAERGL